MRQRGASGYSIFPPIAYVYPMRVLTLSVLLVLAMLCSASACDPRRLPPAYFDHEPTVPYKVFMWDEEILRGVCWGRYNPSLGGCAERVSDEMWFIYLLATMTNPECVLRHEKGHVNGWEHSPVSSAKGRPGK